MLGQQIKDLYCNLKENKLLFNLSKIILLIIGSYMICDL